MSVKTSYLDYYKMVLDKVSFDHQLFSKEYRKAIRLLQADEATKLNHWLRDRGLPLPSIRHAHFSGDSYCPKRAVA